MVLCGQVYRSNCILKSVLVEVRVHTYIPPLETRRTLSLREKHTHTKQLWTEGLGSCATSLPKEGHAAQPHANTSITATITTALAHTQVTNAPDSPVQAVDQAQKEKITSQATFPAIQLLFSVTMSLRQVKA